MLLKEFIFARLSGTTEVKDFSCQNGDLNIFLREHALDYAKELLSVTYIFLDNVNIVAFFSLLNDSVKISDKAIVKNLPESKRRYKYYPAVKIGRLGVDTTYQKKKIGSQLLKYIKGFIKKTSNTGCRFITVDAYNSSGVTKFYENNGFNYLKLPKETQKTVPMYFELLPDYNTDAGEQAPYRDHQK